jgi:hypothetical protein
MSFLRSLLLRLLDFLVKMWLANGLSQRTFPFAVLRNRFAAPLLLFIFGIAVFLQCRQLMIQTFFRPCKRSHPMYTYDKLDASKIIFSRLQKQYLEIIGKNS